MTVRIGINPITWTNDDVPELGGDTVFRAKIRLLPSTLVVPALLIASALLGDSSGRWFTIAFVVPALTAVS